jgi:hypothetical protein
VEDDRHAWHTYSDFGGYFCVPDAAVVGLSEERVGEASGPRTHIRDEEASISGLQYFGLPDPRVVLTDPLEIDELRGMLEELPQVDDPGWNTGPRAFAFSINLPGFEGPILLRDGVIAVYDWFNTPTYYQDIHGLETWLDEHATSVEDAPAVPPRSSALWVRPTVFSRSATVTYSVPMQSHVVLEAFDLSGRRVRRLVDGICQPGTHDAFWDGRDDAGREVSSGVYFFKLRTAEGSETTKAILLR